MVYIKTPSEAMEKGIILLPEDRQKEGLDHELGTWKKRNTSGHQ